MYDMFAWAAEHAVRRASTRVTAITVEISLKTASLKAYLPVFIASNPSYGSCIWSLLPSCSQAEACVQRRLAGAAPTCGSKTFSSSGSWQRTLRYGVHGTKTLWAPLVTTEGVLRQSRVLTASGACQACGLRYPVHQPLPHVLDLRDVVGARDASCVALHLSILPVRVQMGSLMAYCEEPALLLRVLRLPAGAGLQKVLQLCSQHGPTGAYGRPAPDTGALTAILAGCRMAYVVCATCPLFMGADSACPCTAGLGFRV